MSILRTESNYPFFTGKTDPQTGAIDFGLLYHSHPCIKLPGISFSHYLKDRISGIKKIPWLGELVLAAASSQKVLSA